MIVPMTVRQARSFISLQYIFYPYVPKEKSKSWERKERSLDTTPPVKVLNKSAFAGVFLLSSQGKSVLE